jgi:5-methylcytosine-specific restriction endonuclease McrA
LLIKYSSQCSRCGWCKVNPVIGHSPLEIDHIDGDSENNSENNLVLLCPNCHSLTPTYKNLNKGHGRSWRTEKYVKIIKMPL